jgi:hypothetical protein
MAYPTTQTLNEPDATVTVESGVQKHVETAVCLGRNGSHNATLSDLDKHCIAGRQRTCRERHSGRHSFSLVPPGIHWVSFIAEVGGVRTRVIKKIFVTRVGYDSVSGTYTVAAPEGELRVELVNMIGPKRPICCGKPREPKDPEERRSIFDYLRSEAGRHDPNFQLCIRQYLLGRIKLNVTNTPPYSGQFGDLPYQDPLWKILLCVLALLLIVAAAIAEAVNGSGEITTTGGPGGEGSPTGDCCGLNPSGGGTSYVAAGLLAAAAAAATAAAFTDVKDPIRRGQEATDPGVATTLSESVEAATLYHDPVQCGKPFKIAAKWRYVRHTTSGDLSHQVSETNANIHVLSRYEIDAPDVIRRFKKERSSAWTRIGKGRAIR